MNRKIFYFLFPLLIILFVICLFFYRLFYPHLSVFVTPDFGESDLLNGYYPIKYEAWKALQNNNLGLWTKLEGNGYPMFADGQMGSLFVVNLFLFKLLPFFWAINIGYVTTFFIAGLGTYLFTNLILKDKWISLLSSIIFTFSGFMIAKMSHISLQQSVAMLPLELYFVEKILNKITWKNMLLLSIVISQQIFIGHQEITAYSLTSLFLYVFLKTFIFQEKEIISFLFKIVFPLCISVMIGILLSSVLILPSLELFLQTQGIGVNEGKFPFLLKHILLFIHPLLFGTPQDGTYSHEIEKDGIFWENTGYVGFIPVVCLLISLFFLKRKQIKLFLVLTFISILFVLGKYSPFSFLYTLPPYTFFRVPNRMLMLVDFSLALLSAFVLFELLKKFKVKKTTQAVIISFFIIFQVLNMFYFFLFYHPAGIVAEWFKIPKSAQFLKRDSSSFRIFTIDDYQRWNNIFLKQGWRNPKDYTSFNDNLNHHANVLYDIPKSNYAFKFQPDRMRRFHILLSQQIYYEETNIIISQKGLKMLGAQSVKYILTPNTKPIKSIPLIKEFDNYSIFQNPYFIPRARFVEKIKIFPSAEEVTDYIRQNNISYENEILTEQKFTQDPKPCSKICKQNISWIKDEDTQTILRVETSVPSVLEVSDTYYPGWKAYVDNKPTNITATNIVFRSILIPSGTHEVKFIYDPNSFKIGSFASIVLYIIVIFVLIKPYSSNSRFLLKTSLY